MGSTAAADWQAPTSATVFISYSRSEAMLVEDLGKRLEEHGLRPWIDFEELTPGEDWGNQLDAAIDNADVALLVVSRRATQSDNVKTEWVRAKDGHTPMVLAIAEAAELEKPFAGLPWIDVRAGYDDAVERLIETIDAARVAAAAGRKLPEADPKAPTTGFRAPRRVWLAFLASIGVAITSLLTLWTVIVPFVLVPLPVRILRRSFNYTDVRNALIGLPFALALTYGAVARADEASNPLLESAMAIAIVSVPGTFLLIRSGSFRRWVKPSAARPRSLRNVESGEDHQPLPVRYRIDAVPEDRKYAQVVTEALDEFDHERVDTDDAALTLRFISQFHDVTEIGRSGRTLPIIISDPDDEVPPRLQRRQWIDLRRGVDRSRLEAIGRHLDEPDRILEIIGSPPPHEQRILPKGVQGLFVTLWVSIGTVFGFGFLVVVGLRSELDVVGAEAFAWSGAFAVVVVAAMLWLTRKLRTRRPGRMRASLIPLLAIGSFLVFAPISNSYEDHELTTEAVNGIDNAMVLAFLPFLLLIYYWLFRSSAIRLWIPSRSDDSSRDGTGRGGTTGRSIRSRLHLPTPS